LLRRDSSASATAAAAATIYATFGWVAIMRSC
jgi:hypothetical protein